MVARAGLLATHVAARSASCSPPRYVTVVLCSELINLGYFILINLTIERYYCTSPFVDGDTRFLVQASIDFCRANNRFFLRRDEWLRVATCASAFFFWPGYLLIALAALTNSWRRLRVPLLLFIGAKTYAMFYYHFMEFMSDLPPQTLAPLLVSGPYFFSIAMVLYKVSISDPPGDKAKHS